jgi:hypothetical protein
LDAWNRFNFGANSDSGIAAKLRVDFQTIEMVQNWQMLFAGCCPTCQRRPVPGRE